MLSFLLHTAKNLEQGFFLLALWQQKGDLEQFGDVLYCTVAARIMLCALDATLHKSDYLAMPEGETQ